MTDYRPHPVLITGATGLVGSYIARQYLSRGHAVSALKRAGRNYGMLTDVADQIVWHEGDVLDIPSLEAAIEPGCDVIHAAALVSFAPKDRLQMDRVNVEGTANVVNVCLSAGVRKLGYVSSIAALGRPATGGGRPDAPLRIDENQKWEDSPHNSAYAKSKYRAELEVWRGLSEGLNAVMVCPSLVFGAGDWSRSSLQLIKYAYDEKPFYPAGIANYVDVLDVAEALYGLMETDQPTGTEATRHDAVQSDEARPDEARRYILSAGTITYQSLLTQIAEALGRKPPTIRVPPLLTRLLWPLEAVRAWLTGKDPLITRETARSASQFYQIDGRQIEQRLGFRYRPLQETLERVSSAVKTPPNSP